MNNKETTVIQLTKTQLETNKLTPKDFIEVNSLTDFGFTSEIVNDMVHYEIFPQLFKIGNKITVLKTDIFGVVETLLKRSMTLYKAVEAKDKLADEIGKSALPVDELDKRIKEAKEAGCIGTESIAQHISGISIGH